MIENMNMIDEHHRDFFLILGYLASPTRRTKLDIETHPRRQPNLEREYFTLTGVRLVPDNVNFFVLAPDSDKWGSELRIYFHRSDTIPQSLKPMVVRPRNLTGYHNARVNKNKFVWGLIKYGFRARNTQDETLIKSKIPPSRIGEFNTGFNL